MPPPYARRPMPSPYAIVVYLGFGPPFAPLSGNATPSLAARTPHCLSSARRAPARHLAIHSLNGSGILVFGPTMEEDTT